MKLVAILLAVFCADALGFVVHNDRDRLSGKDLVDYVNSVQNLFVAEENGMTEEEIKSKVMDFPVSSINMSEYTTEDVKSTINDYIPDSFDSRTHWPSCKTIKIIRNQWSCGCCWAMSAAEVISDRICIKTNGRSQPEISVDEIISCAVSDGCTGGLPIRALYYWTTNGIVTGGDYGEGGCKPYSQGPCDQAPCSPPKAPACTATCKAGYPIPFANDKHFGLSSYSVDRKVASIQTEILTNGPVVTLFSVFTDFVHYKSGVYKHTAGSHMGLHAVKMIGWGTENGTPYWIVANSWGKTWGDAGFFKILRGADECGIEEFIVAGISRET